MAILINTQIRNDLYATGSITAGGGFTGSLQGTASHAISASYALNSSGGSGVVSGGSYNISASWASQSLSASWAPTGGPSVSASFADNAMSASWAPSVPSNFSVSSSWASRSLNASTSSISDNAHNVSVGVDSSGDSQYLTFTVQDGTYPGFNSINIGTARYQPSTNTITATNFQGTASWASSASWAPSSPSSFSVTSSWASSSLSAISSSWASSSLIAVSASWASASISSSFAKNSATSSVAKNAETASYLGYNVNYPYSTYLLLNHSGIYGTVTTIPISDGGKLLFEGTFFGSSGSNGDDMMSSRKSVMFSRVGSVISSPYAAIDIAVHGSPNMAANFDVGTVDVKLSVTNSAWEGGVTNWSWDGVIRTF